MEVVCPRCGQALEVPCDIEGGRHLQCFVCSCRFSFVGGRVVPLSNDDCNVVHPGKKRIDLTSIDPFGESKKPSIWKRFLYNALSVFIASIILGIINSLSCSNLSCSSKREPSVGERLMQHTHTSIWRAE